MSRFDQKYHKKLLRGPKPENWRNTRPLRKERQLWDHKKFIDNLRSPILANLIVYPSCAFGFLFIVLFALWERDLYFWLSFIVAAGPAFSVFIVLVVHLIWCKVRGKRIVQNRNSMELDSFISNSSTIQKYNKYYIKAIRQTLGYVYSVNPEIIYLSDSPESLRSLGCIIEPYGFEVILGVIKRLGIYLTESEIDRIANKIHNSAYNVEELTSILCEEMSMAEESQSRVNFEAQRMNATEKLLEKKGKHKFRLGLPGFIALMCFLGVINAELEESDNFFSLPTAISVLKAVVIGYFIGLAISITGKKLLKYLANKKHKESKTLDEIDLEELKDLADNSPVKRYVNCLIKELYYKQDHEKTLKKYEPLPMIDDFDQNEMPWFSEVSNRLKKMAKIEQIPFIRPQNEKIALVIDGQPVDLNVELCDGLKNGYVKLSINELNN